MQLILRWMPLVWLAALLPGLASAQITDAVVDDYVRRTLEDGLDRRAERLEAWKVRYSELQGTNIVTDLLGYQPPGFLVDLADLASYLYTRTGEAAYAETTRDLLVEMESYRRFFPEAFRARPEYQTGVPVVNWFRALPVYVESYQRTKDSGVYSAADVETVRQSVAVSVEVIFAFPEWGAMNRALLRAESLLAAAAAFPGHERAPAWRKMAEILASDSIEAWEIEDASSYHPIWLRSLIHYLDLAGRRDLFQSPMTRYYFDYFVRLLTPDRTIPEFGDGTWAMNLNETVVSLERGAKEYRSGEMKWAAREMLGRMEVLAVDASGRRVPGPALDAPDPGLARALIRLRAYAAEDVEPVEPRALSGDALDDVIGKKIVFRSGWDPRATYLLLNYKDEGYDALMQKNYLKDVLAVEEEKMHHGHADENSVALFMKDGAVLLADGGYRPYVPSGPYGAWRSDFYHNRLVVRPVKKAVEQSYFDVLRNAGAYNDAVRTTKLDFQSFPEIEYSRTRLEDRRTGYRWDRILVRHREEDFFVVVDALRFLESGYFTAANLWHTRQIVDRGEGWMLTRIDSLMGRYPNPGDLDLLVVFPQDKHTGTEPQVRAGQREIALYQGVSRPYAAGEAASFVTVLVPLPRGADPAAAAARFRLARDDEAGLALEIAGDGGAQWLAVKLDPDRDRLNTEARPRYTYASGRLAYGPVETDADMAFVRLRAGRPVFSATHLVRLDFDGEILFDAPESQFFQVWGRSDRSGRAKWRRWDNY